MAELDLLGHSLMVDYYGKRLATCSSDRTIHVFDHNTETQSWDSNASWKAHDSTVLRVYSSSFCHAHINS